MNLSYNVIHAIATEYAGTKCYLQEAKITLFHPSFIQADLIESGRFNHRESEELMGYLYDLFTNDPEINWLHTDIDEVLILLDQPTVSQFLKTLQEGEDIDEVNTKGNFFQHPPNKYWDKVKKYLLEMHSESHICPDCQEKEGHHAH